jgi:hypothetical protein
MRTTGYENQRWVAHGDGQVRAGRGLGQAWSSEHPASPAGNFSDARVSYDCCKNAPIQPAWAASPWLVYAARWARDPLARCAGRVAPQADGKPK